MQAAARGGDGKESQSSPHTAEGYALTILVVLCCGLMAHGPIDVIFHI